MQQLSKFLKKRSVATLLAIVFGFVVAALLLALTGYDPIASFGVLLEGVFAKPKYISQVLIKATPIIFTGLSVAFAFQIGLFNIGAEGQYIMGTVCATMVGILVDFPPILQVPCVLLAGTIGGAIFGGLVGYLKAKFEIHEVITSIMLNWIAFYFCNYIVNVHKFHQPNSTGTYMIHPSGFTMLWYRFKTSSAGKDDLQQHPVLREILLKTDVNAGIIIAILLAIVLTIVLKHSVKGYQMRAVGLNLEAARASGISIQKNTIHAMLIAGAISGLAGALTITGMAPHKIFTMGEFENNGFQGLSVALVSGNSPIGCIFTGIFFAALFYGGGSIQSEIGAPSEIIQIMIGTIVFFVALARIVPKLVERLGKRGATGNE